MIKKKLLSILLLISLLPIVANLKAQIQDNDKEKIEVVDFFSDDIDKLPPPSFEEKAKLIIYFQQVGAYALCKYVDSRDQLEHIYNKILRIFNLIRYNI